MRQRGQAACISHANRGSGTHYLASDAGGRLYTVSGDGKMRLLMVAESGTMICKISLPTPAVVMA